MFDFKSITNLNQKILFTLRIIVNELTDIPYSHDMASNNIEICLKVMFLNSLMIHQVKTKEITTVKEVWMPSLSKHRF